MVFGKRSVRRAGRGEMKKVVVIECDGMLERDVTSYGYQYSVHLQTDLIEETEQLKAIIKKNTKVKVRIEIDEQE